MSIYFIEPKIMGVGRLQSAAEVNRKLNAKISNSVTSRFQAYPNLAYGADKFEPPYSPNTIFDVVDNANYRLHMGQRDIEFGQET